MSLPQPEEGLVISYAYLWRYEHSGGIQEGRKTRPCVIVLSVEETDGEKRVTVAPITHVMPEILSHAIEIPHKVKQHLHLDDEHSWIMLNEVNQFKWPGYDLRPVPGRNGRFDFGFIPPRLFFKIKTRILDLFLEQRVKITERD